MIENGFVYAFEQYGIKKAKKEAKQAKRSDKFYTICRKYNKSLDELNKNELLKSEYKFIIEYIQKDLGYPLRWYENLI